MGTNATGADGDGDKYYGNGWDGDNWKLREWGKLVVPMSLSSYYYYNYYYYF